MTERANALSRLRGFVIVLLRRSARLRLAQTAASLAFLSLLALVPVATLALSLLGALPMLAELRGAALRFVASNLLAPSLAETLVHYLNQFAEKAGELSAIGALVFFATAFTTLLTIDRTLNRIWGDAPARPLARRLTIYWTFLTLGPLLVGASVLVNGAIVTEIIGGVALPAVRRAWLLAVPWATTIAGLTLLYRLVPNAAVRWRDAIAGALCAAVALELLKRGFAFQVARIPTYTVVYGAFATLPLLLVWLFLLWLTVLGGALVTASLPALRGDPAAGYPTTPAQWFELGRGVLLRLARAQLRGAPAVSLTELRGLFSGNAAAAQELGAILRELDYVDRFWIAGAALDEPGTEGASADAQVWNERWALAREARSWTLRPLFERLWRGRATGQLHAADLDAPLAHVAQVAQPLRTESARPGCP
ncbi:MAG: YihY family inner membrane protein [Burkholderiaceae bacterium]|nr:YihY family inner membrane protein [Burkholderiaceae bacterium]